MLKGLDFNNILDPLTTRGCKGNVTDVCKDEFGNLSNPSLDSLRLSRSFLEKRVSIRTFDKKKNYILNLLQNAGLLIRKDAANELSEEHGNKIIELKQIKYIAPPEKFLDYRSCLDWKHSVRFNFFF